jgi:hypothetical protein
LLPTDTAASVFEGELYGLESRTLLQLLQGGGGSGVEGAARILLRAAVAALLNSAVDEVGYPLAEAEILAAVSTALATGDRSEILELASELDRLNNAGECPLN